MSGTTGALSRLRVKAIGFPGPGSGRDLGIDALKGFAILLVVLGHSLEIADAGLFVPNASFRHHIGILIYTFHMPLFMFLAGYVMSGKKVRVGKSFVRLVVPFFAWMVVRFFIFFRDYGQIGRFIYRGVWGMENAPLWFLWTLFMCYLLLILAQQCGRLWRYGEELGFLALFVLVNLIPTSVLGIPQLQYYFLFFALGYLAAKYKTQIAGIKPSVKTAILVISPVAWLGLFFVAYYKLTVVMSPIPIRESINIPVYVLERFALAIFGILSAFTLLAAVKALKAKRLEASFGWLGLATMDIYVTHGILIHLSFGTGWTKVFSAFFIAVIGGLALTYLLLRNWRFLSYPFLGRSYRFGPRYRLELAPEAGAVQAAPVIDLPGNADRLIGDE
jgi:fucose 4-O-acetylase-like acetyltransferase